MRVVVRTMGPACGVVASSESNLLFSTFNASSTFDASTGYGVHVFDCPDCAFHIVSDLQLAFHASCQNPLVTTYAVQANGFVSAGVYLPKPASYGCQLGQPCLVAVAMAPTITLEIDESYSASIAMFDNVLVHGGSAMSAADNALLRGYNVLPAPAPSVPPLPTAFNATMISGLDNLAANSGVDVTFVNGTLLSSAFIIDLQLPLNPTYDNHQVV
jgi:hypothetical protein